MRLFADHASLRRWVLSSLTLLLGGISLAQDIPIGTWRTHFSYHRAKHLAVTQEKIFCASENGFFSRDLANGSTRVLSKVDGLSAVGISALGYHEANHVLVIGYNSGYVDFVFEDHILSVSDIATSSLDVDKSINDIAFRGGETYLATDLGVIVIATLSATIRDNFVQIGPGGGAVEVLEIEVMGDTLFIRTEAGVQSGKIGSNLLDFEQWTRYDGSFRYTELTSTGDDLYMLSSDSVLRLSAGAWQYTGIALPSGASQLFASGDQLLTIGSGSAFRYGPSGFSTMSTVAVSSANDLELVGNELFIADDENGLIDTMGNNLSPAGPWSDEISNIKVVSSELYAFHAPSPFIFDGSQQQEFYSLFSEGTWAVQSISGFTNIADVASYGGQLYFASIGSGLLDHKEGEIIKNIPGSSNEPDSLITALSSGDRLWVSSFGNSHPIHTLNGDEWESFPVSSLFSDEFLSIDIAELEVAWLGSANGSITVFEPEEKQVHLINTSNGLPSSFIDIDISIEDNAWVATGRGPVFFQEASFVFSVSEPLQPTFESRRLFEDEQINAVLTDGGNRIWFGTNRGLWIYDENTSHQIAHFHQSNSPLPSDHILQLAYNGHNGEVFVLTDRGLVSYRSGSSIGSRTFSDVIIFPNPVRPGYTGQVGLSGLVSNVSIKVTDIYGNLVKEISSNGGSASWDLRDTMGREIQTGVYLFFSATSDGERTFVGKIAVIR